MLPRLPRPWVSSTSSAPGVAPVSSPAVINRLHLLSPLGGFVAQFPPNCSISGCKNQGERSITAAVFQVTAPTVENKDDEAGRNTDLAGVPCGVPRARLLLAGRRWGSAWRAAG